MPEASSDLKGIQYRLKFLLMGNILPRPEVVEFLRHLLFSAGQFYQTSAPHRCTPWTPLHARKSTLVLLIALGAVNPDRNTEISPQPLTRLTLT